MKRRLGLVTLGLVLGAGAATALDTALAGEQLVSELGMVFSQHVEESFEMSYGYSAARSELRARPISMVRKQFNVPDHYGALLAITDDRGSAVFWFVAEDGVVRNAVVRGPASQLVALERKAVRALRFSEGR